MVDVDAFLKDLGQRIADLRKDAGLTQAQLARKVGVSQQIIASYENGKRNFPVARLLDIAEVLEIPAGDLLTGAEKQEQQKPNHLDAQLARIRKLPASKRQFIAKFLETILQS